MPCRNSTSSSGRMSSRLGIRGMNRLLTSALLFAVCFATSVNAATVVSVGDFDKTSKAQILKGLISLLGQLLCVLFVSYRFGSDRRTPILQAAGISGGKTPAVTGFLLLLDLCLLQSTGLSGINSVSSLRDCRFKGRSFA